MAVNQMGRTLTPINNYASSKISSKISILIDK